MKLTRQLRLDALAKDGTSPIQLTITWEGNCLRLGTGAVVRPEHWDGSQVKVQAGTPHASINPRLNRASEAAAEAQALATKQGRKLPKDKLKAAVEAALHLAPVAEQQAMAVVAATEAAAITFESLYRAWLHEQLRRPRGRSGKPLAKTTKAGFLATLQRRAGAGHRPAPGSARPGVLPRLSHLHAR